MARMNESTEPENSVPGGTHRKRTVDTSEESQLAQVDAGEIVEQVVTFARENPHAALAGAAVVGFVLGGGLTPRLVGALGMIAARRYMKSSLGDLASILK